MLALERLQVISDNGSDLPCVACNRRQVEFHYQYLEVKGSELIP
jgi:hypothetical protein